MNTKTPTPELYRKEVYNIPCQDCDSAYIGKTGRSLGKGIADHTYVVDASGEGHRVEGLQELK